MRRMIVFSLTALFFLFGNAVIADTIYTWTDADGIKRYSNSQPPEDAENVQTIQEIQYDQRGDDQSRQEYDRMVKDASESADRHFEEQADKKAREAKAERERQLEERARQIEEERSKLQKEIDDLKGRAIGPTFSPGQKEYLIKQVQEKINRL
ncbi:MAG: DUF4124 domain-containing protein [Desulfosarcina sp.]|nr:DUF4124 domain-containing protein [Desulfosarcina sp.]MBC2768121.1 DUF4124 domain-containing protein [Desulfosarcina sp.]